MHAPALGYEATPPLAIPLRFFLTAPLFGALAGGMLFLTPELLSSRWTPGALSVTHLLSVGFLLMVIVGALFQVLPVVCGAQVWRPQLSAGVVHVSLVFGTIALAWGLFAMNPALLTLAAALLGCALGVFLLASAAGLLQAPRSSDSQRDLRLSLAGLALASGLGVALALTRAGVIVLPFPTTIQLHIGWAWLGGVGMLIAATSWVVIPMFQITPPYPRLLVRFWAPTSMALICAWSIVGMFGAPELATLFAAALVALALWYLVSTLVVLGRSRRARPDASLQGMRFAVLCLLCGTGCYAATWFHEHPALPVLAGILILYGGFVGIIQAMLYKIVPFLAWLHLTQARIKAPNVHRLQPEARVRIHWRLHACALAALVIAVVLNHEALIRFAAILIASEFVVLFANLVGIILTYRKARDHQTRPPTAPA